MVDIDVEDLGVRVANLEVRKKSPDKHSGFFITISTNFKPGTDEDAEDCAEKLRTALKAMLTEEANLKKITTFLKQGDEWNSDTIQKVSSQFVVERGRSKYGGRIHAHAALHINHRSMIRLNIPEIKEVILPYFDDGCTCKIKNLYVNVRIIRADLGVRQYLTKESA